MKIELSSGITVKTNHWWPKLMLNFFKGSSDVYITLGKTIHLSGSLISSSSYKHEKKHVEQYSNLTIPGFIIIYCLQFVWAFLKTWNFTRAYQEIGLELAAFEYALKELTRQELDEYDEFLSKVSAH